MYHLTYLSKECIHETISPFDVNWNIIRAHFVIITLSLKDVVIRIYRDSLGKITMLYWGGAIKNHLCDKPHNLFKIVLASQLVQMRTIKTIRITPRVADLDYNGFGWSSSTFVRKKTISYSNKGRQSILRHPSLLMITHRELTTSTWLKIPFKFWSYNTTTKTKQLTVRYHKNRYDKATGDSAVPNLQRARSTDVTCLVTSSPPEIV